jgi:protein-L-isoaspartate(D-aspartate) O-methyltransferase
MTNFAALRKMMVDCQIRTSDVTDRALIAAFLDVPREHFVPAGKAELAYLDSDIAVTEATTGQPARHLLKPMVLAKLLQAAEIKDGDHVLDVGCATGYASAVLARLAHTVVALEQDSGLAAQAAAILPEAGARNVTVVTGPLLEGWKNLAPYDVILLNGAAMELPAALLGQLKDGGRIVGIVGGAPSTKAMVFRLAGQAVSGRPIFDASAPVLPGMATQPEFVF